MTEDQPIREAIKAFKPPYDRTAKFYFVRAWGTTWGILAAWTLWVLLPAIVALIVFGTGMLWPGNDDPTMEPSEPTSSSSCDPSYETC